MINLSIIIPVYNNEVLIKRCLKSIFDQTNFNFKFEVITVNDGSKDNTLNVLYKLQEKYVNLKVFNQNNLGSGAARNTGVSKAKGTNIWFIDSDDFIEKDAFSIIQKNCLESSIGNLTLGFNYFKVNKNTIILPDNNDVHQELETYIGAEYINSSSKKPYYLWVLIFNKSIIDKYNIKFINNIKNLEDLEFSIKYFSNCKQVLYVNKRLYNYYDNNLSTSRDLSQENLLKLANDTFIVHKSIKETIKDNNKYIDVINEVLSKSIIGFFFSLFKFNYTYKVLKSFYNLYRKESLLPTKIKNVSFKFYVFEKFVNYKYLFLTIAYLKKIKNK
jgi:glycosyltransferase involved in cell wall biosynthesis